MSSNPAPSILTATVAPRPDAEPPLRRPDALGTAEVIAVPGAQLERIALSSVRLAAIGPQLASLAARLEAQADTQARQAEAVAGAARSLTERLGAVVARLQEAS